MISFLASNITIASRKNILAHLKCYSTFNVRKKNIGIMNNKI